MTDQVIDTLTDQQMVDQANALLERIRELEKENAELNNKIHSAKDEIAWWMTTTSLCSGSCESSPPRNLVVWRESDNCFSCHHCLQGVRDLSGLPATSTMMILCPKCGNKRCPKATYHRFDCTGSNDVGQEGSRYAP